MRPFRPAVAKAGRQAEKYVKLKGVDMSSDPTQIGADFSPWCPNLISDNGGNPEKRLGWRTEVKLEAPINGIWFAKIGAYNYYFVHAGTKLYVGSAGETLVVIRSGLLNARSAGFQMNDRFWLLTGREYIVCGLFERYLECRDVAEIAYVPTVVIARSPTGGGTPYEPINLLSEKQINSFLTTEAKLYQLTATDLKSIDKVVLGGVEKKVDKDYWADLIHGTVYFLEAMPAPSVAGADNLQITFSKFYRGYRDRVTFCTMAVGYGYGANDRIFFSGNGEFRNMDWFSGLADPSYVGDVNYSKVGGENTSIMGYHRLGEYLAVFKEANGQDSTIYLRSAQVNSGGDVVFPLRQGFAGVGAVSPWAFAVLKDEPLFLSRTGVYAVTSNTITTERTVRNRSFFIDSALTKEPELKNAAAVEWNGYYVLAAGGKVYLLDGNSPKENLRQYSTDFAYRCYHWENVPAAVLAVNGGELWFGTADGRVCRFNTDVEDLAKYNDDGKAIVASWATKADDDGDFMTRKTLVKKGSGVMIKPYTRSSVHVLVRSDRDCLPREIRYTPTDIWNWEDVDFTRLNFNSNDAPQVVPFLTKIKKYITLQIIVENRTVNEGFGVYGIMKRYIRGNFVR